MLRSAGIVHGQHDQFTVEHVQCGALVLPEPPPWHRRPQSPAVDRVPGRLDAPADRVLAGVLTGGVVDREDDQLGAPVAVEVGHRDSAALILPAPPIGHRNPWRPIHHGAVGAQPGAEAELAGVLAAGVVDGEHDQRGLAADLRHGDVGALVFPPVPVGNGDPWCPPAGHGAVGGQSSPDAVVALVLLGGVVDHEHHQIELAGPVEIGHGDAGALILPAPPIGHLDPRAPRLDRAVRGEAAAYPVEAGVLADRIVDHQHHHIGAAVTVNVGDRQTAVVVLPGEPVRNRNEIPGHRILPSSTTSPTIVEHLPRHVPSTGLLVWILPGNRIHVTVPAS